MLHASVLGTTFEGRILGETTVGERAAIVPSVRGSAFITGVNHVFVDPEDPFPQGYLLEDTFPGADTQWWGAPGAPQRPRRARLLDAVRSRKRSDQLIAPATPPRRTEARDPNAVYALGADPAESARLRRQADELAADTRALLDRVVLRPRGLAIDLGCGPHGALDLLAERVRPGGLVVGLDANPVHTAIAAAAAPAGVDLVTSDARRSGIASASFDVVHARALLVNIPEPGEVVTEMVRLAKPGGWVASMEPDTELVLCHPPLAAFERICEIFPVVFARNGADPRVGRRVPSLLREAGLADVGVEVRAQSYPPGNTRRTTRLDLVRSMRTQIVEMGLASAAELEDLDSEARAHIDDPRTILVSGLLVLSWGRKPT
jgi:SAM-dependent methyltransferase